MAQDQAGGIEGGCRDVVDHGRAAPPRDRRDRGRRWLPVCSRLVDLVGTVPGRRMAGPCSPQHPDRTHDDF